MKMFLTLVLSLGFAFPALAKAPHADCPAEKGYSAKVLGQKAEIWANGEKAADLELYNSQEGKGADELSVYTYIQNRVNGYMLIVTTGGFSNVTTADVRHGGFIGYISAVTLICK